MNVEVEALFLVGYGCDLLATAEHLKHLKQRHLSPIYMTQAEKIYISL